MQRSFPILTLHRGNDSKFIVSQESFLEAKSKLQVENSTNITDVGVDDFNASVWQVPLTYISDESLQPKTVWLKSKGKEVNFICSSLNFLYILCKIVNIPEDYWF